MPLDARTFRKHVLARHREEIKQLHAVNPLYNLKILALFSMWVSGVALLFVSSAWWMLPVVWLLCTSGLLGMAILMHDAAHHLLARSGTWNRWLGFLCGAPVLISSTAYRYNHTEHHAFTGTDRDSGDPVAHANKTGLSVGRLMSIFLVFGTVLVIPSIAHGGLKKADKVGQRQILLEYALITLGFTLFLAVAPWTVLVHAWLIPFLVGSFANNVRSMAEHALTERTDSLRNVRTMKGSWYVNFVQSNVNLHWEHHLFPGVPWYNLPRLHALLDDDREELEVPTAGGYLAWMWREVVPALA